MNKHFQQVAVVGAGAMGQGIAQMAAQAGAAVFVHDVAAGAADKACASIRAQWQKMLDKGRLSAAELDSLQQRLSAASQLGELAASDVCRRHVMVAAAVQSDARSDLLNMERMNGTAAHEHIGAAAHGAQVHALVCAVEVFAQKP